MSCIAIVGAGAIGGALAQKLAVRGRVSEVRLIDDNAALAQGKALDILQSSPVESFSTRLTSAGQIEAAAGASVIVLADAAREDAEHAGDPGLALLKRLTALDTTAPILCAGASQLLMMSRAISELHVSTSRLVGSAPTALESAVRALTALEINGAGADVHLTVVGVPPKGALVAWEAATASGQPLAALMPPHRMAAISARLSALWPPGPLALASAAARVAEALVHGSRRSFTCFAALDESTARGGVAAVPVRLAAGRIERVLRPALSRQEQTQLENALAG